MLNIERTRLAAASLASFALAVATIAIAQDNSSSAGSSNQPASSTQAENAQQNATNPSNLPASESSTTTQQTNAPVVDPQKAAQDATGANTAGQASSQPASDAQNASNQKSSTADWPAPERYESSRLKGSNATPGQGGASLGVNVVGSEDGQGIVIARIRPGTPADQMGLQPRDRILSLNGQPVGSVDQFIAAIRGMAVGDQVQLSIDRGGNSRDINGRLEAFRSAVAAGEGPVGNIIGRAREIIRDRPGGENLQTSYEDRSQGGRQSGDLEARLSRVEQQLNQLMRDVAEIRTAIRSNPATSPGTPSNSPAGQPSSGFQPPSR